MKLHGIAVREVFCKSALTKSGITDYAINPYVGCAHNCVYCHASFMARFSRHDRPWGQWVDVKVTPLALADDLLNLMPEAGGGGMKIHAIAQRVRWDLHNPREAISSTTDRTRPPKSFLSASITASLRCPWLRILLANEP